MNVQADMEQKLRRSFDPDHLEVINESSAHNVPPGSESHFKVVIVSSRFEGQGLVARHRSVHEVLAGALAGPVHALSIRAHTPAEWQARGRRSDASPPCLGGGRQDRQGQ
ncbi:MAG TPA: BolA/IbaG family iron-sulfur metabolism protein [Gammaproteobacteria bacterium]|nr:BolA/IbaG family iron-sulfur metabolism protein [Gammaproteobacteria bacterium]